MSIFNIFIENKVTPTVDEGEDEDDDDDVEESYEERHLLRELFPFFGRLRSLLVDRNVDPSVDVDG